MNRPNKIGMTFFQRSLFVCNIVQLLQVINTSDSILRTVDVCVCVHVCVVSIYQRTYRLGTYFKGDLLGAVVCVLAHVRVRLCVWWLAVCVCICGCVCLSVCVRICMYVCLYFLSYVGSSDASVLVIVHC